MPGRRRRTWIVQLSCLVFSVFLATHASGQIGNPTTESGMKPYGSYESGEIDSIALLNGKLNLDIPLVSWPQRGNLKFGFTIRYDDPRYQETFDSPGCGSPTYPCSYSSEFDGQGVVVTPDFGYGIYQQDVSLDNTDYGPVYAVVSPDGSSHQIGGGRSVDATGFKFDHTNSIITDPEGTRYYIAPSSYNFTPGALPYHGVTYSGESFGGVTKVEDTNGNQVTLSGTGYSDSLERITPAPTITTDFSSCTGTLPISSAQLWQVPGPKGGTANYKLCYATFSLNFNLQSGLHHNPFTGSVSMLQSIVLPNNTAWTFQYDPNNGMLIEVTLPTGGTVSYGGRINVVCLHGSYPINYNPDYGSRSVNANDGTGAHTWTYNSGPAACPTSTTVTDPLGNQTVHTFTGLNSSTSLYETQAQYYSGSSSLLKTVTTNYTWNANVSTLDGYPSVINVVPTQVTTTWPVTGGTTVSKVEKDYDAGFSFIDPLGNSYTGIHYGDIVTRRDYDYGSGAPGPLLRRTVTSYQAFSSAPYLTYNLLDAISSVAIYDSTANTCLGIANPCAYTSYGYDATALAGSTITIQRNLSPVNGSTRGNQTSVSPWLNASTTSTTNCSAVTTYLTTNRVFYDTGMVSTSTDPCGYVTTHLYSSTYAGAYTTTLTNPLGQNTTFSYDVNTGLLASTFDANLQPTSNTYDNMGRLAQVSYPDGGQANYCYTDAGGTGCTLSGPPYAVVTTQKITASLKRISTSVFDGLARPIQKQLISDPDGVTYVDITYDADGRAATHSNPHRTGSSTTDGTTTTLYDALNRVCLVAPADAASPPTSCPSSSSLGTAFTSYSGNCTTVTDETGKSRTSCVDGLGRMTDVREDPSGFNYDTAYQYDTLGNMKSVTQKGGAASGSWRTRSFIYNLLSQVTSSNNPESGIIGYTYDADGNAITKTAPMHNQPSSGVTVTSTYSYDKLNRLIKESYSDGTATAQFGYDGVAIPSGCVTTPPTLADSFPAETRTSMCDGSGAASWKHDEMGRVVEERRTIGSASGKFIEYTYNLDGSLLKLTTPPLKTVVYTIGGAGRPLSAVDSADSLNFVTGASYAPHGELKGMVTGSTSSFAGFTITNGYNDRLQPVLLSASSPTRTVFSVCYDFHLGVNVTISPCSFSASTAGDNGSVYQVVNNRDSSRTQNLTYDNLNRIATGYSSGAHWGETFTVDPWSNLVGRAPYLTKPNYEPLTCAANASNQLTTCFGYDAAGNTTNNGSAAYTYDAENRITSTGGMFYTYDGEGNRVRKCSASPCTTGSTGTLYWRSTGGETLDESDLSGNATEEYVFFNGQRIARRDISTNVLHYYFSDYVNSTGVVENAAGTACEQDIDYYPYGGVENDYCVTPVPQNYKFTGKERDNESGLDDFDARYYASTMGRFMTPDWDVKPVTVPYAKFGDPQTLNLYGYVENSPVDRMDPSGHFTPPAQDMGFACDGNSECLARETGDQEAGQTQREAKYSGAQNQKAHNNVAMAAEKDALRRTRAALKHGQRVEYGGWIIQKNKDGSLSYTKPIKGGEGEFDLDSVTIPKGFTKVSPYHTHPHTRKTEGEGADPGDVNVLRNMVHDEHVDRVGYVADTFSGSVYRYTQWEPVKSMYDTSAFGTKIGTIPPD